MKKNLLIYLGEAIQHYTLDRETHRQSQSSTSALKFLRWLTPNGGTLLLVIALIATAQVWARPLVGPTDAPGPSATTINYQGHLADAAGNPKNGTFSMQFALYDDPTAGNLIWGPEEHGTVKVSDGLFSVGLGSETTGGIPISVWNGDRYLEITVDDEVLSPRELIRSVPIAGMALTVPDGAVNSRNISNDRNVYVETQEMISITGDGVWNDLDGVIATVTPEVDSYAYVYASAYGQNDMECLFTLRAVLNDETYSNVGVGGMSRRQASETRYYGGAAIVARFELKADVAHTIKLQGRINYADDARVWHRSMAVIVVKQ